MRFTVFSESISIACSPSVMVLSWSSLVVLMVRPAGFLRANGKSGHRGRSVPRRNSIVRARRPLQQFALIEPHREGASLPRADTVVNGIPSSSVNTETWLPRSPGGLYAGTPGLKTNFGLNVKFNKSSSNLQGNVNIVRRVEAGVVKVYRIKSNAIESLNIQNLPGGVYSASFTSKANLTDITNPSAPVPLGGNRILQITMTDRGEPGAADTIGITLDGGATFSSSWSGSMTLEQSLGPGLGGGNLQVRPN